MERRDRALGREHGHTLSELALMWTLASPGPTCSRVGSRTVAQLEANLRAAAPPLVADAMARLHAFTHPLKERLGPSFDYDQGPENDRTRQPPAGRGPFPWRERRGWP